MIDLIETLKKKNAQKRILSARAWETFIKSPEWKEIKNNLECCLIDTWQLLEDPELHVDTIRGLQGRARCLREQLVFPETEIAHIKEEMEDDA